MPEYDGTGPRGLGPMTGGGRGYCLLQVSPTCSKPLIGFVGLSGNPVNYMPVSSMAKAKFQHCGGCRVQRRTEQKRQICSLSQIGKPCRGQAER